MFRLGCLSPRTSSGAATLPSLLLLAALLAQEGTAQRQELFNRCGEGVGDPSQHDIERCARQDDQCHKCIQTPGCQWCSRVVLSSADQGDGAPGGQNASTRHCFPTNFDLNSVCRPEDVEIPCNQAVLIKDEPLSEVLKNKKVRRKIIQLRPQHVRLSLRKGTPYNLTLKYRQVSDHPVDLYYLMDLSNSMRDDKDNLSGLGSLLASTMRALTSQFRLGFGSFVDKTAMPFINTHPSKLKNPCTGCVSPYSFKNVLPLNENDKLFTKKVKAAPVSGNQDSPEGGFDALMQAIVCPDLGWRNQSRRIIIFSTDAKFHQAGDGKLAGIVTPNDGRCHLDSGGSYTNDLITDYPSIAQINEKVREHQVNVIFAVTKEVSELYSEVSKRIAYSSFGVLDSSSSNVVQLVEEQYKKITSSIKLSSLVHAPDNTASVRFFSSCKGRGPPKLINECDGMREGDEVDFLVEITAERCLEEGEANAIEITTSLEKVLIDLHVECDCNCEKEGNTGRQIDSDMCSGEGTFQCGVCACNPGFYGKNCQCNAADLQTGKGNEDYLCRRGNETQLCSGRGVCQCGQCSCRQPSTTSEDIWGVYCECNRGNCRNKGKVCSDNGECECNSCRCNQGWQGRFCQCPSDDFCIPEGGTEVCSGHGDCACGRCQCREVDGVPYTGKFCDECSTCPKTRCAEFRDCVLCLYGTGNLDEAGCRECTINPIPTESLQEEIDKGASLCTYVNETTRCEFKYTYYYIAQTESYEVFAKSEPDCPEEVFFWGIVFSVIAAIVAIGLLTLIIWKILTTIHDRKEYARFEEERNKAKWNTEGNPIYQPATNTFQNPVFGD